MKLRAFYMAAYAAALLALFALFALFGEAVAHKFLPVAFSGDVRSVGAVAYEMDGPGGAASGTVTLPHNFKNLPPRTRVSMTAKLDSRLGDSLLIKAFYSPLRVYADGKLLYEYGQDGSYPGFLNDPPTVLTIVQLPYMARELRMEYLSPRQRDRIEAQAVFLGNDLALFVMLIHDNAVSLIFSTLIIFFGVILILLPLFLLRDVPRSSALAWLGLFALSVGAWGIGECDLSLLLIPYPTALHLMAFIGLFSIPIPFLAYGISILDVPGKKPLWLLLGFTSLSLAAATALQAAGILDLSRSLAWFHFSVPAAMFGAAFYLAYAYAATRNVTARRFIVPILTLALFSVLEVANYSLRFTNLLSLFFQTGVILFIFSLGIVGGKFSRDAMRLSEEKRALEANMRIIERGMETQRGQYAGMVEYAERQKALRHDLRHHMTVMRKYIEDKDMEKLKAYIDEMDSRLTFTMEAFCKNYAVNAVAGYYLSIARQEGVLVTCELDIPEQAGRVHDMDLCIVVGNFLENALEACRAARCGERFIRARSKIRDDVLSVIIENSFDGVWSERGGVYLSRKSSGGAEKPREGIGISSARAVCDKYDGMVKIDIKGNTWKSGALLDLTGRLKNAGET